MSADVFLPLSARCDSANAIIDAYCGAIDTREQERHHPQHRTAVAEQREQHRRAATVTPMLPATIAPGRDHSASQIAISRPSAKPTQNAVTTPVAVAGVAVADLLDVGVDPAGEAGLDRHVEKKNSAIKTTCSERAPPASLRRHRGERVCAAVTDGAAGSTPPRPPAPRPAPPRPRASRVQCSDRLTSIGAVSAPMAKQRCSAFSSDPAPSGRLHITSVLPLTSLSPQRRPITSECADHERQRRCDGHEHDRQRAHADRRRPPTVPVAAVEQPAGRASTPMMYPIDLPDEHPRDAAVVGAHAVAEVRQRRAGRVSTDADEDEADQIGRHRGPCRAHVLEIDPTAALASNLGRAVASATDAGPRRPRPSRTSDSFNHAIADACVRGAAQPRVTTVHAARSLRARASARRCPPTSARRTTPTRRSSTRWCAEHAALVRPRDAIVFVYPTWWSSLPAILKGWLERVLVPGVGFRFNERGRCAPACSHVRHVVGISTYGSPWRYVKPGERQRSAHDPAHRAPEHRVAHPDERGSRCTPSTPPRAAQRERVPRPGSSAR